MKGEPYLSVKHRFDCAVGGSLRLSILFSSSLVFVASRVFAGWYPHDFNAVVTRLLACGAKVSSKALCLSAAVPRGTAPVLTTHVEAEKSSRIVKVWQRLFWARNREREQGSKPSDEDFLCEAVANPPEVILGRSLDAAPIFDSDIEVTNEMEKDLAEAMGAEYLELCEKAQQGHL